MIIEFTQSRGGFKRYAVFPPLPPPLSAPPSPPVPPFPPSLRA